MGTRYEIVPALPAHIAAMESRIRPADVEELQAAAGLSPKTVMEIGLARGEESQTLLADGLPICMFGVTPINSTVGLPWMVGTDDLEAHRRFFLQASGPVLAGILGRWGYLVNWVDARNLKAVRWLRWLGFTLHPAKAHGLEGRPFHMFERRGHVQ